MTSNATSWRKLLSSLTHFDIWVHGMLPVDEHLTLYKAIHTIFSHTQPNICSTELGFNTIVIINVIRVYVMFV